MATTRHEHFKDVILALLGNQSLARVAKIKDPTGDWPYCYPVVSGGDKYDARRDERNRPILDANDRGSYPGTCEFFVRGYCKVARDIDREGTLEIAMGQLAHELEGALKYGSGVTNLSTDDFDLTIREVYPLLTLWSDPEGAEEGMVEISGYIDYIQNDK